MSIGGGSGGLAAAWRLRRCPAQLTLVDRTSHHLFQMLYRLAMGLLSPGEVAPPLRVIRHRQSNLTVRLAEVTGADVGRRVVELCDADGVSSERVILEGVGAGALARLARAGKPAVVTTGGQQ